MPTYHYQCDACRHAFDIFQKFSEDTLRVCPECDGSIRRVIQVTPVVFKGSGWYINDSKPKADFGSATAKDGGGDNDKDKGKTEAKPDAPSEAKPETKPDVKTEAKPAAVAKPEKAAASVS